MPSTLARGLADEARRHLRTNRTRRAAHRQANPPSRPSGRDAAASHSPQTAPTGRGGKRAALTAHNTAAGAVRSVRAVCTRRRLARLALPVLSAASVTDVVAGWGGPAVRACAGGLAFALWLSFPLSWGRPFIDWFVFGRDQEQNQDRANSAPGG